MVVVARSRLRLFLEATAHRLADPARDGICGDAEWCVRAPSPILYTVTCIVLFLAARALYGARIGFWSAVVFATLPAASFSSLLISTDVPLILFWTLAFYGWIRLIETREMRFAALIGASIGLGLLAKYAAAYFVLCVAVDAWRDPRARDALRGGRGLVALAIALRFIAPNVLWNANHSFATFSHTAENAGWKDILNLGSASSLSARNLPCSVRSCLRCSSSLPGARCGAAASSLNADCLPSRSR